MLVFHFIFIIRYNKNNDICTFNVLKLYCKRRVTWNVCVFRFYDTDVYMQQNLKCLTIKLITCSISRIAKVIIVLPSFYNFL